MDKVLLACDLDRTLLPNGTQPESPQARPLLRLLVRHPGILFVCVSGRGLALVQQALKEYELPTPDFVIGDVGSSIYARNGGEWAPLPDWTDLIASDFQDHTAAQLAEQLVGIAGLTLQPPEQQAPFKLSYFTPGNIDHTALSATVDTLLAAKGVRANLIWSRDETRDQGLFDVLPASAGKLQALQFLCGELNLGDGRCVFAGDSGNDIAVLVSGLSAVLVANAHSSVREQVLRDAVPAARLYLARGGFLGMNGNYAAGVLEGVAHFLPELRALLEADLKGL